MASYVANHIRVICPSGLLCSTNSFLMNLSYNSVRKVTKRTPPRPVCPSGPRGIRLCLRAVLTRRPGSTGLNPTSLSDFPYQSRMPRQTSRGSVPPVKLRSLDGAQRNPGNSGSIGKPRISLPYIRATGHAVSPVKLAEDSFTGRVD